MTADQQDTYEGSFEPLYIPRPVYYSPERQCWQVSSYADVKLIESYQQRALFLREYHSSYHEEYALFRAMWGRDNDPLPAHTHLRNMTLADFREESFVLLEQETRAKAHELLALVLSKDTGSIELAEEFSRPLAQYIVCEHKLGIDPELDGDWLYTWLKRHPSVQLCPDTDMIAACREWIKQRAIRPQETIVDKLINLYLQKTIVGDQPMTDLDLIGYIGMLAVGGYESLGSNTATVLAAIVEHRDVLEELRATRGRPEFSSLLASTLEEALRLNPSYPVVYVTARETLSLGGETIPQGEDVMAWLSAANRDPAMFPHPEHFDMRRSPNPHMTFGFGMHYCMGAGLSRLIMKIAIEAFLDEVPFPVRLPSHEKVIHRSFYGWDYSLVQAPVLYGRAAE